MSTSNPDIQRCVLALLEQRAATASICPSDVARALVSDDDDWRALMPSIREVAARMARENRISITQGGATLDPDQVLRGPIRLRRGSKFFA